MIQNQLLQLVLVEHNYYQRTDLTLNKIDMRWLWQSHLLHFSSRVCLSWYLTILITKKRNKNSKHNCVPCIIHNWISSSIWTIPEIIENDRLIGYSQVLKLIPCETIKILWKGIIDHVLSRESIRDEVLIAKGPTENSLKLASRRYAKTFAMSLAWTSVHGKHQFLSKSRSFLGDSHPRWIGYDLSAFSWKTWTTKISIKIS